MIGAVTDPREVVVFLGNNSPFGSIVSTTESQLVETPAWSGVASRGSVTGTAETRLDVRASVRLGRGKVNTMPPRRLDSPTARKTSLQVIQGALSLYRVGDRITFLLNDVEFTEPVEYVETAEGKTYLYVTVSLGVCVNHVSRVERRGGQ